MNNSRLLHYPSGVLGVNDLDERVDVRFAEVDFAGVKSKSTLTSMLAKALDAENGFGGNWDALADIIRDRPPGLDILVCRNSNRLSERLRSTLLDVFSENNDERRYGDGDIIIILIG